MTEQVAVPDQVQAAEDGSVWMMPVLNRWERALREHDGEGNFAWAHRFNAALPICHAMVYGKWRPVTKWTGVRRCPWCDGTAQ